MHRINHSRKTPLPFIKKCNLILLQYSDTILIWGGGSRHKPFTMRINIVSRCIIRWGCIQQSITISQSIMAVFTVRSNNKFQVGSSHFFPWMQNQIIIPPLPILIEHSIIRFFRIQIPPPPTPPISKTHAPSVFMCEAADPLAIAASYLNFYKIITFNMGSI